MVPATQSQQVLDLARQTGLLRASDPLGEQFGDLQRDLLLVRTRDADLLGYGASDLDSLGQIFRDIAGIAVNDGIVFDPASVVAEEIRREVGCAGARITINVVSQALRQAV